MRIRPVYLAGLAGMSAALVAAGCNTVSGQAYAEVQRELLQTQEQVRQLQTDVAAREQALAMMKNQTAQLRGLEPQNLEQLIVPVRIELASQSGGFDSDDQPGDDGIVLYVQPIDRDGHVVKAAGSITVTLLDLANPPEDYVVGKYHFDINKTRELWAGRLWTHHFTVRCPWFQGRPPAHNEITARVEFLDLLTGQTLTTQGVYKIKFPPGHVAAGTP